MGKTQKYVIVTNVLPCLIPISVASQQTPHNYCGLLTQTISDW